MSTQDREADIPAEHSSSEHEHIPLTGLMSSPKTQTAIKVVLLISLGGLIAL